MFPVGRAQIHDGGVLYRSRSPTPKGCGEVPVVIHPSIRLKHPGEGIRLGRLVNLGHESTIFVSIVHGDEKKFTML
jgi:hypothetical protein